MDQAAQQPPRVAVGDQLLPGLELDLALVLGPGAVLGKEVGPVLGEGVDLIHPSLFMAPHAYFVRWHDQANRGNALIDDDGVSAVQKDPQSIHVAWVG